MARKKDKLFDLIVQKLDESEPGAFGPEEEREQDELYKEYRQKIRKQFVDLCRVVSDALRAARIKSDELTIVALSYSSYSCKLILKYEPSHDTRAELRLEVYPKHVHATAHSGNKLHFHPMHASLELNTPFPLLNEAFEEVILRPFVNEVLFLKKMARKTGRKKKAKTTSAK